MTIEIGIQNNQLIIRDEAGQISGKHSIQLDYWGFKYFAATKSFAVLPDNIHSTLEKLLQYFSRHHLTFSLDRQAIAHRNKHAQLSSNLQLAMQSGLAVKNGDTKTHRPEEFIRFLSKKIPRKLKDHQIKSALHLLAVGNGANFSVPGSGKTTVVLAVFHWLRQLNLADALFVVGPPSCFGPWRAEYRAVIGLAPKVALLAGGDIEERRRKYSTSEETPCDLYLTTFQTLQRDWALVRRLFEEQGLRFYFVVDEAHYIKQLDGAWANAVLNIAPFASHCCVLTGTPFPRKFSDAFNLFDALWPNSPPLTQKDKIKIESFAQQKKNAEAVIMLQEAIGPLFYRVRKSDLGLAPQKFHAPIMVKMKKHERMAYDAIIDRLSSMSHKDYMRNIDLLAKLKRGRMIRLRQCISYTKLLGSAVSDYSENLLKDNLTLSDVIKHYEVLEVPAKIIALVKLVNALRRSGEKVLIWSNFVQTLKLIRQKMKEEGHGTELIYGQTPTEDSSVRDVLTREKIIAKFLSPASGIDVLVANPAACAESISLHKTCSHAIYYDLSYNCAQYLQSLDRIHRVGGSEKKTAHYYFLQYENTIDGDILANVDRKAQNMNSIIDQDYPIYSLDMFSGDEELEAYERLFG